MIDAAPLFVAAGLATLPALDMCFRPFVEWTQCYCKGAEYLSWAMPGWLFLPMWIIFYGFATAAEIIYALIGSSFCCGSPVSGLYASIAALWFFNILLVILWKTLFFKRYMHGRALCIAIVLFLDTLALAILYGTQMAAMSILPFIFWIIYTLWIVYIGVLNITWVANYEPAPEGGRKGRYDT